MTYARSRLLLGMFGVGSIVVLSSFLLVTELPLKLLPNSQSWSGSDLVALAVMFGCMIAVLFPLDLLGGFLLPNRRQVSTIALGTFLTGWFRGVLVQASLFFAVSLLILAMGRWLGVPGAAFAVASVAILLAASQLRIAKFVGALPTSAAQGMDPDDQRVSPTGDANNQASVAQAMDLVSRWGWKPRPIVVLQHLDVGFTGGVVGLPGRETVVLAANSLTKLSTEQLAITIARRLEAIRGGSRTRGLMLALTWVLFGFALSTAIPGAGVSSVGQLAMTSLGFTLWTFFGLLTLPTLSRQASHAIDGRVLNNGVSPEKFREALKTLDTLQDDEPQRPALIEAIFHPVPSIDNRHGSASSTFPIAWHAARVTLFISWACMGMLVRAVHCNVGRPELWVMLPAD